MNPLRASARFLFESGSPRTMALFRITLGLAVLFGRLAMWPDVVFFFSDEGLVHNDHLSETQTHHFWSVFHLLGSPAAVWTAYAAGLLAALALTLGLFTRTCSVLLFVLVVSLRWRSPLMLNSGDQLMAIMSFWLMFADSGRRWSIDAWWRARRGRVQRAWNGTWVLRSLQLQLCFLYAASALYKLEDPDWVDGETMFYVAGLVYDWVVPSVWMMDYPAVYKAVTWGSIAFELGFPLLAWNRWTRRWMVALGILFHIGIALTFGLYFFSAATIVLLMTFIPIGAPDCRAPAPA